MPQEQAFPFSDFVQISAVVAKRDMHFKVKFA
jgi:hypothetical protein